MNILNFVMCAVHYFAVSEDAILTTFFILWLVVHKSTQTRINCDLISRYSAPFDNKMAEKSLSKSLKELGHEDFADFLDNYQ